MHSASVLPSTLLNELIYEAVTLIRQKHISGKFFLLTKGERVFAKAQSHLCAVSELLLLLQPRAQLNASLGWDLGLGTRWCALYLPLKNASPWALVQLLLSSFVQDS